MENVGARGAKKPISTPIDRRFHQTQIFGRQHIVVAALVLGMWEILGRNGWLSPLFFPIPSVIFATLIKLLTSGELTEHLVTTLYRLWLGLVTGGTVGLLLGLFMGWSTRLRRFLDPFVAAAHPVPKISLLPLFIILLGIGDLSKIVVVGLASFFPMLINAMVGVQQIDPIYYQVATNYGAKPIQVFTKVVFPGSLPLVLAGTRLALNAALMVTIAVELVTAQYGLGAMIWQAWETLHIEALYASILVTAFLGILFSWILRRLSRILVPWQPDSAH